MLLKNLLRDAGAFLAEHEEAVLGIGNFGIQVFGFRRRIEDFRIRVGPKKILITVIDLYRKILPVIHSGSFQMLLVKRESERPDQVKPCTRSNAGAAYIAGILGNLRLMQYNVNHVFCAAP